MNLFACQLSVCNAAILITILATTLTLAIPLFNSIDTPCQDSTASSQVSSHEYPTFPTRLSFLKSGWGVYRLWAFPTERESDTVVYLRTSVPALVSYVLGPTWRSQLAGGNSATIEKPTGNWSCADEMALAMRIRQVGGALIDVSDALGLWWLYEGVCNTEWSPLEKLRKYIFGWPDGGGVWVLTLPLRVGKPMFELDQFGNLVNPVDPSLLELDEEDWDMYLNGGVRLDGLRGAETMEEYCEKLKELGARFYENPRDSEEVMELELLDGKRVLRQTEGFSAIIQKEKRPCKVKI